MFSQKEWSEESPMMTLDSPEAVIANCIRNPLLAVRFQLEIFKEQMDELDTRKEVLTETLRQIDQISDSVELVADRASSPEPQIRNTNVIELIKNQVSGLEPLWMRKGIEVSFNPDKPVVLFDTDSDLLGKSIFRILKNAIEASPEDATVEILFQSHTDSILIQIADQGQGMSEDAQKTIGKPFVSQNAKGMGLGLFLSKRDIQSLGGNLEIESTLFQGTTASIFLPTKNK